MNYVLTPSLQHIALVKIATTLWNQDSIRVLISEIHFPFVGGETEKWQVIEDKVVEKVPQLPETLKEEVLGFIKAVGLQILKWKECHDENLLLYIDLPNELYWTPQGTIDKKKTAEILIKDESLCIDVRYTLACIYCLENDILKLWNKIPEKYRKYFYSEEDPICVDHLVLVVLWTYDIRGEVAKMNNMIEVRRQERCSPYQFAFEHAAVAGNKAATEYFFHKLTSREREDSLVTSAKYVANRRHDSAGSHHTDFPEEFCADVLCFLLAQMNAEQQTEVFKSYPYEVLKCLLDWPWQSLFVETANRMWDFLSEQDYNFLLRAIVHNVKLGYKDCNYQKLFEEFWRISPNAHKRYVIHKFSRGSLLSDLLEVKDKKNISLILKDATLVEKEKIIFYREGKDTCESLIYSDEWDLLKFLIEQCIPTKEVLSKFHVDFKERCSSEEKLDKEKVMWSKFFKLLDDLSQEKYVKRRMEGESSPSKRLRNTEFEEGTSSLRSK